MCVHWALAKGSAPSTPARRFGAPHRFRPRSRCGRRRVACGPDMTVRRFATTRLLRSDATLPSSSSTASATPMRRTDTTTTAQCRWSATSRCTSGRGGWRDRRPGVRRGGAASPRQTQCADIASAGSWHSRGHEPVPTAGLSLLLDTAGSQCCRSCGSWPVPDYAAGQSEPARGRLAIKSSTTCSTHRSAPLPTRTGCGRARRGNRPPSRRRIPSPRSHRRCGSADTSRTPSRTSSTSSFSAFSPTTWACCPATCSRGCWSRRDAPQRSSRTLPAICSG